MNLQLGDSLSRDQRLQVLQQIDMGEVRSCTRCVLCETRTQTVFGEGNPEAQVMFIGEGPGEQEDKTGRPFVGPAGQLLDKMINAMGLSREAVYIANIVKCRPPNNRPPQPDESDACSDYLARQIALVMPRAIVTLGAPATKHILDTTIGITALRGKWSQYTGLAPQGPAIPVMPTYHPSYILRAYTVDNRKKVWGDLQAVMERIKQD